MSDVVSVAGIAIVTRGDCLSQITLLDYNCEKCIYFDHCNNKRKGKEKIKKTKKSKK